MYFFFFFLVIGRVLRVGVRREYEEQQPGKGTRVYTQHSSRTHNAYNSWNSIHAYDGSHGTRCKSVRVHVLRSSDTPWPRRSVVSKNADRIEPACVYRERVKVVRETIPKRIGQCLPQILFDHSGRGPSLVVGRPKAFPAKNNKTNILHIATRSLVIMRTPYVHTYTFCATRTYSRGPWLVALAYSIFFLDVSERFKDSFRLPNHGLKNSGNVCYALFFLFVSKSWCFLLFSWF